MRRLEIVAQAIKNVRSNLLRASLTLFIIAFGIMALVGILTALDSIIFAMSSNFSGLGSNSFSVVRSNERVRGRHGGRKQDESDVISYRQALDFKERFGDRGKVSVSLLCSGSTSMSYAGKKTNPNIMMLGVNEHYFDIQNSDFEAGRPFSDSELQGGSAVTVIGRDLVKLLFADNPEMAIGRSVSLDGSQYTVVGVLASKGSSMQQSSDRMTFIPIWAARNRYDTTNSDYDITVAMADPLQLTEAMMAANGLMRQVRHLRVFEEDDFEVRSSEGLLNIIKENTVMIRSATVAIGLITLLGAAIGLMNIMLVSVTERTREIGITKALGATQKHIRQQFLTEAVLICQAGGIVGIILGVGAGNLVSMIMESSFIVPWNWIFLGLVLCLLVGVAAGYYPARRASMLDPIESLRYE